MGINPRAAMMREKTWETESGSGWEGGGTLRLCYSTSLHRSVHIVPILFRSAKSF
jgi:hypothetical protein